MTSPTPPEKALKRVLVVSRLNGWSVIVIAALGMLLTLALGDLLGTAIGLLAVASGWMEVHGNRKLRQRDPDGMRWLVRSQLFLLAVVLVYCASRLGSYDADTMLANLTPDMEAILQEAGIEKADLLPLVRQTFVAVYVGVAATVLIYQGGMALYYRNRTRLVTEALTVPPEPPSHAVY